MSEFCHLHAHSCYSFRSGASTPVELIETARAQSARALALTDTNGLYGAIPFYQLAHEHGIKPILGVQIVHNDRRAVCLARSRQGYANLCRIVTERHLREPFNLADALARYQTDLFVLVDEPELLGSLAKRLDRDTLYAELVHNGRDRDETRRRRLYDMAQQHQVPVVASGAVRFHAPERHRVHQVLSAIDSLCLLDDVPAEKLASPEAWLAPAEVMARRFRDVPDALRHTLEIAERCECDITMGKPVFPSCRLPGDESPDSRLGKLCFAGLAKRYESIPPEAPRRLQHELGVIRQLGFAPYFLIVWDIVRFARREGIPVVGRGSAADSLASYCLGISNVDPLAYDLYFERFLNLSRTDCPDIDLDFCWRRRDEVLNYIYQKYGARHVAMIATHTTFQARSAFRDIAKVYGLPPDEVDALASQLPFYSARGIRDAVESFPEARDFPIDQPLIREIVDMAGTIDGYPRHLSIHVGGVVIADRSLPYYVPLERAPKGLVITQYDMGPIEALGLVKMDILAQRSLSIIQDTVKWVHKNTGQRIDPDRIADGDPKTAGLLRRGQTTGCFQIESPGMHHLLQMMKAQNRLDVIHALSLIRPGPSSSGMKEAFVKRRLGRERVTYLHPALEQVLADTYGIMLYQEDILKVAHAVAGFDLAVGDELRKAMTKGRQSQRMAKMRDDFIQGALAHGARRGAAEKLWELVSNFAQYSYCKAHACTYGHISYQATYLKAHYPGEYLVSVLNNQAGFYEPREYLEEARRWGVQIRLPHVNHSEVLHTAGRLPDGTPFIRIGLAQVAGLHEKHKPAIVAERRRKSFRSLPDLCRRVPLGREEAANLVLCGALDDLGHTRPEWMWMLDVRFPQWARRRRKAASARLLVYDPDETEPERVPALADYPPEKKLELEHQILKLTPSAHPLAYYDRYLDQQHFCPSTRLPQHVGRTVTIIGWLIATRRARTRNNELMKFMTLEDRQGTMEVTLFPSVYQRYGHVVRGYGPYVATGKVENHHGAITLNAARLDVFRPPDSECDVPARCRAHV